MQIMLIQLALVVLSVSLADAANVYKQSFTFSDQTQFADLSVYNFDKGLTYTYQYSITARPNRQFADLSVYNFDKGLTYTYQYSITARPNRQVTIHFLTNLTRNANIVLYNGADATAPKVDISNIYKIVQSGCEIMPYPITSTGRSFFLEVTPLTTNAGLKQDFQALATDIVQPSSCGALVRAAGENRCFPKVDLGSAPGGCIHIIRSVDTTNNKYARLSIDWIDNDVSIYKGLSMTPASKLVTLDRVNSYNEKHIILQHKNNMTDNFGYIYDDAPQDALTYNAINSKQTTMFVTADYLPARPMGATEVTKNGFVFTPMFRVDTLKVNFLSGIGSGNLQLTYLNYQDSSVNKTVSYTKANLPKSLTIKETEAYQFLLNYSCTGAACSGMYGTVEDATVQ